MIETNILYFIYLLNKNIIAQLLPQSTKFSNNEKCIFKCHVKLNEVEDEETRAHKHTYEIK